MIGARGGAAIPVEADLGDPGFERGNIVRAAENAFGGPVAILVNNAAAPRRFDMTFAHMDREQFQKTVEVNLWAAWDLALRVLPGMRQRGQGWILNISSRAASPKIGPPYAPSPVVHGQSLYGGTKAMLDRLTTGAAMELLDEGIAINALAPEGAVATDNAMAVAGVKPTQGEPLETMAAAALALCSGDPKVLTGRVAYSLSLVVELDLAVTTLDGASLVAGWQPADIDRSQLFDGYLRDLPARRLTDR